MKSLREGKAQIAESYARFDDGELWLFQMHVPPWVFAVGFGSHDPDRTRKLLVHHHELDQLADKTKTQPLTIVPLKMYFKDGHAKVEIALAKGKKQHDRRQAIAEARRRTRDRSRDSQRGEIRLSRTHPRRQNLRYDWLVRSQIGWSDEGMIGFDSRTLR